MERTFSLTKCRMKSISKSPTWRRYTIAVDSTRYAYADSRYLNIRKKAFPWKHGDVCSLFDKHCKEKVAAQEAGENWKTAWHHKGDDSEAAAGHGH